MPEKTTDQSPRRSIAQSASVGLFWVSVATVFAKSLAFISQIVLGFVLAVETYALFGLVMSCIALIAGFQSPSVSKALIQDNERFDEHFPTYSAFAFQFGLIGSLALIMIGLLFEFFYQIPYIFAVLCVTSLTVPIIASNTTLIASLSVKFSFRDINVIEIKQSALYYGVLISAALLGAEEFTVVSGLLVGTIFGHLLLRRHIEQRPSYYMTDVRQFFHLFRSLKWVLIAAFLAGLALRSDFFVLAKMLTIEQIGFYSFGFMLVTSITIPISAGINQVFMPIFAQIQTDITRLRIELVRFSSAITIIGGAICILILGCAPVLLHLIWGGKWDGAQIVIIALAISTPFRFLATISGVGLDALGLWRLRSGVLAFEAILLATFAGLGAYLNGIHGAIAGVALQRALSGVFGAIVLAKYIEISSAAIVKIILRIYMPFLIACGCLLFLSPSRHGVNSSYGDFAASALETLMALIVFLSLAYFWNKAHFRATVALLQRKLSRD